jgi:hypothetical protein
MILKTLTTGITAAIAFSASADNLVDPAQLLTHEVYSHVQFGAWSNTDQLNFDPASEAAECAHASMQNSLVNTYMAVTNHCESSGADIDVIQFDWRNNRMTPMGITAQGITSTIFSAPSDADIALSSITNNQHAPVEWNISLYDEDSSHVGDLNSLNTSLSILEDVCYELVFSVTGADTFTSWNTLVTWDIQIEYSQDSSGGASAVPGFGGLAFLGGLGAVRRRRRH